MKPSLAIACLFVCLFTLPGCNSTGKIVATPPYLQADLPSDPPGLRAARAAERAKRVKEGNYKPGEQLEVHGGKVYVFRRNPDIDGDAAGRMVSAESATVVVCEGLYYYVQLSDKSSGYVRETDLVNPQRLVAKGAAIPEPNLNPNMEGTAFPPQSGVLFPEESAVQGEPIHLDPNQKLMTNNTGRTVVVVNKSSERSQEFEARKKALLEGKDANTGAPAAPSAPAADDVPDLPDSSVETTPDKPEDSAPALPL